MVRKSFGTRSMMSTWTTSAPGYQRSAAASRAWAARTCPAPAETLKTAIFSFLSTVLFMEMPFLPESDQLRQAAVIHLGVVPAVDRDFAEDAYLVKLRPAQCVANGTNVN